MVKIVYFDEMSASDYVDISSGGKESNDKSKIVAKTNRLNANAKAGLAANFSWLPFVKAKAETGIEAEIARMSDTLIKTTISNTILTDFLVKVKEDRNILKLEKYKLSAYPESFSFFKMYTPYLVITKQEVQDVDLARIDEAFEKGKGYYELIAEDNNDKIILRFNIKAFRNNYGLADLLKMRLVFHAVEVGETYLSELNINNEFPSNDEINVGNIMDKIEERSKSGEEKLKVFDVILAGVE